MYNHVGPYSVGSNRQVKGRLKSMGKSTNGPGWEDIADYVRMMDNHYKSVTSILMLCDGSRYTSGLTVSIFTVRIGVPGAEAAAGAGTNFRYPNRENLTMEGAVFKALVAHDAELTHRGFLDTLGLN
jgi:hypothetical protein